MRGSQQRQSAQEQRQSAQEQRQSAQAGKERLVNFQRIAI